MKIEFGVAVSYHTYGAKPEYMTKERFENYDDANTYANTYRNECEPTIYCIIEDKYAFYCKPSRVYSHPYCLFSIQNTNWGQIETRIWWSDFMKNPEKFFQFAVGILEQNNKDE